MTTASYKYAIKSASGYSSDQKGKITPERHGVVCAALDGLLADDADLLKAAPDLLEALEECLPCLGWESDSLEELQREHELGNGYAELIIRARVAIARAKGEQS